MSSGYWRALCLKREDDITRLREELEKAKRANDELFKIKQKCVIANRELIRKLAELEGGKRERQRSESLQA